MPTIDISKRLPRRTISADINAYNGINTIQGYSASRPEAGEKHLKQVYDDMLKRRQQLAEHYRQYQAMLDDTRLAEWDFHNAVLAMRESVRAQFGPDSNEAQAVGLKKKSKRKRPSRQQQILPMGN